MYMLTDDNLDASFDFPQEQFKEPMYLVINTNSRKFSILTLKN